MINQAIQYTQHTELIIFDWDGTLMDSEQVIVYCMQGAITDMGLEPRTDSEVSNIIGLGLIEAATALYPGSDTAFAEDLANHYRKHWYQQQQGDEDLFPGIIELLYSLREHGVKLAIATGKSRRGLNHILQKIELEHFFDATRCADETRSKPHPQMLLEILEELQLPASAALMVGDTEYDLEMATRAGMASLAVCYGVHAAERLYRHQPIACVDDLRSIEEIIKLPVSG